MGVVVEMLTVVEAETDTETKTNAKNLVEVETEIIRMVETETQSIKSPFNFLPLLMLSNSCWQNILISN